MSDENKTSSRDNDNAGKDDDGVIKVKRTSTSPALLSQLQHSRQYQQARGLGAGATGASTWLVQRTTALALIPLAIWFAVSMVRLSQGSQAAAVSWLAFPVHAVLMALFIVIALRHAVIGLQIVLEDYVSGEATRTACVLLIKAGALVTGAAAVAALIWLVAM